MLIANDSKTWTVPATGTTLKSFRKTCHKWGNTQVWQGKGVTLFCSGSFHGARTVKGGIHINLGPQNDVYQDYYASFNIGIDLPKPIAQRQEILLTWDDFDKPTFRYGFWRKLADGLLKRKQPVLVFCQGGHGRTGTCAAILLGLWGVKRPISYLRQSYCREAVESPEQAMYVNSILTEAGRPNAISGEDIAQTDYRGVMVDNPDDDESWYYGRRARVLTQYETPKAKVDYTANGTVMPYAQQP